MSRRAGSVSEETKMKLLQTAAEEFSEKGFASSSLRQICQKAGVTTGALYFFFDNKENLFKEVLNLFTGPLLELIQEHYKSEEKEDLLEMMDSLQGEEEDVEAVLAILNKYYENETLGRVLMKNLGHPVVEEFFDSLADLATAHYQKLIERIEEKFPRREPIDPFAVHWFAHLEIKAAMSLILHGMDEEEASKHVRGIVKILRGGFISLIQE